MSSVCKGPPTVHSRPCGLCQRCSYRLRFVKDGYQIGRCTGCGLVQVLDDIADEKLRSIYDQGYYTGANNLVYDDYLSRKDIKVRDYEERFEAICAQNNITSPGSCLEIGCAFGFFLDVARRRGWSTKGIELSAHSAGYAREQLGLDVSCESDALQRIPSASQDLVAMWDVIEHLKDPLMTLREIRRVLTSEGLLVFATGDIGSIGARLYGKRWHLLAPPYHLFYFDRNTVRMMLKDTGFTLLRIRSDGHPLDNHGSPRFLAWVAAHDRHIGWRLDSGPIMTVTAQRDKQFPTC